VKKESLGKRMNRSGRYCGNRATTIEAVKLARFGGLQLLCSLQISHHHLCKCLCIILATC
jgi:hypothetical protein